jgi:hypothetical protein
VGRLDPNFDKLTFAEIVLGSRIAIGIKAFSGTNYKVAPREEESRALALLTQLLKIALVVPEDT